MRKIWFVFSAFFVVILGCSRMALGLSPIPPAVVPCEASAVIDGVAIKGGRHFSEEQIRKILFQRLGDEINSYGVQSDLRAIASLYRAHPATDTEAWSGFELITSQITVTSHIVPVSPGHVTVTYNIKEWFPPRD